MHTPEELHTQIQYRLIEQLGESERKYRKLVESLTEVVFEIDTEERLTFLNPAWTKTLGYSIDTSMGHPLHHYCIKDDQHISKTLFQQLRQETTCFQSELRFVHAEGHHIWMSIVAQPNTSGGGSGTLTDISEQKKALKNLQYHAEHDALTGLMNRAAFLKRLEKSSCRFQENTDEAFAILFLDLDRFKSINDNFGHLMGDKLLTKVAQRLEKCIRSTDFIARIGGDEFNLLVYPADQDNVIRISERINTVLEAPFHIDNRELSVSTSIGIVISTTGTTSAPLEMLQNADTALYQAKNNGRKQYAFFDQKMQREIKQRLILERDLRHAIEQNELLLFYQPIVDLKLNCVAGFEALLRWQHPQLGWIPPDKIIPIAEESGQIVALGWKVLEIACKQRKVWEKNNVLNPKQYICVNFSSHQFLLPNFVSQVQSIFEQYEVEMHQIKLEITETSLMTDVDIASRNLEQLHQQGINISIDDFGTGYSSLSYLNQFPISTLKIDRSFIHQRNGNGELYLPEIVSTIILLGNKLGMEIIAEGVETNKQLATLRSLGCEMAQGYFWSKPMEQDAVKSFLNPSSMEEPVASMEKD